MLSLACLSKSLNSKLSMASTRKIKIEEKSKTICAFVKRYECHKAVQTKLNNYNILLFSM